LTCTSLIPLCNSESGYCRRHCPCTNCAGKQSNERCVATPATPRPKRQAGGPSMHAETVTDDENS
jgi:hypothetical protein